MAIPPVTMGDRDSRHRAVRGVATALVAVTADQASSRAAKVTAVERELKSVSRDSFHAVDQHIADYAPDLEPRYGIEP